MKSIPKNLLLFVLTFFITGLLSNCSKEKHPLAFVVINSAKSAAVVRGGKSLTPVPGFILKEKDTIKTSQGSIDIQSNTGTLIRIKEYSTFTIDSLKKDGSAQFYMNEGSLLANVKKVSARDDFIIQTPTAIAGVRGTVFSIEVSDGSSPLVRVYSGKVAYTPSVPALREFSREEIEKNPELKKLTETLSGHEIIIESETEGEMHPDVNRLIQMVNGRIEKKEFANTDIFAQIENSEKKDFVKTQQAKTGQKEKSELATLAGVDNELIKKRIEAESSSPNTAATEDSKIAESYNKNLQTSLESIINNAKENGLKSDEDFKNYYNIIEQVVNKDGTILEGAVVSQVGDQLILHTTGGISRILISDINYIELKKFDVKTKKK